MPTQKGILNNIAGAIIDILPQGQKFNFAVLEIKRLTGNVGLTGHFYTPDNQRVGLKVSMIKLDTDNIHYLYTLTQNEFPVHKNWNRAKYVLYPTGKFEIEYIWDQELQYKVDRYNSESK